MKRLLIKIGVLVSLAGCTSTPSFAPRPYLDVEVLGMSACPSTPVMVSRVKQAAVQAGFAEQIRYVDLEQLPPEDPRRAWPAPTVLVDGRDLMGITRPSGHALSCQVWPDGVPSVDDLASRLRAPHARD